MPAKKRSAKVQRKVEAHRRRLSAGRKEEFEAQKALDRARRRTQAAIRAAQDDGVVVDEIAEALAFRSRKAVYDRLKPRKTG